ncbi:MAG: hypothetical protein QOG30_3035 [Acidimicrobiaceae bacterium]|jgi:hypothetical protein
MASRVAVQPNPFEEVTRSRVRPGFTVEPLSIAWAAVAFRISGSRECVACVPRAELGSFFEELDAGRLDDCVRQFLASAPSGRVLRAADQTQTSGLFDDIASPDAIVAPERVPGSPRRLGFGRGGGGTPSDARRQKRQRRPRAPRGVVVGAVVAGVVVVGVVIAVTSRGSGDSKSVAVNAGASTTVSATTQPPELATATSLGGVWSVARTVTSSTNPRQPVGQVLQLTYTITSACAAPPCTLHVVAEGSQGAIENVDLTFVGDHYEGAVNGQAPCRSFTTGELLGETTLTGSLLLRSVDPNRFTGNLTLNVVPNTNCVASTIDYTLAATK